MQARLLILLTCLLLTGCFNDSTTNRISDEDSHALMVQRLADIAARSRDENIFVGDRQARLLRQQIGRMSPTTPVEQRWLTTFRLAKAELHLGNEAESIRLYEAAVAMASQNQSSIGPDLLAQLYFDKAVAHLRYGETQNCCRQNLPASCILPFQPEVIHQDESGSRAAIVWLSKVLELKSADDPMHLAACWLLNLAYMTVGEYPEGVPEPYRIVDITRPSKSAALDATSPKPWPNVAAAAGVATFSLAGGAIAEDFDNDSDIDLVVSSSDPRESLKLFWNDGTGKFTDGSKAANLHAMYGGLNLTQTDFNNDGHIDIFVMRGGWLAGAGQHPNSLLKNQGDGTFIDVTLASGLAMKQLPCQAAAWADYDLDGDLDLYLGNEHSSDLTAASQLFRNNGDETFTEVTDQAGVANNRLAKAVAWGDYDGDRFPDLYVSNYRAKNRLYHNNGDGTFTDVATERSVDGPLASFPTWFCDVNNDGQLDLFVAAYTGGIAELAASHLGKPFDRDAAQSRLYVGDGQGRFQNESDKFGLSYPMHPMGANFGDTNGDGFVDFYFGTGWPEYHELMPNLFYESDRGTRFHDRTMAARVGHLQKGHAVAIADFDNDGDADIFEQMGGFVSGDQFYDVLFQNPGPITKWLKVRLVGDPSNRPGIGARIRIVIKENEVVRSIFRTVSSGGSFGANPLEQLIGLSRADEILRVEVFWPASNTISVVDNVQPNQRIVINEKAD